MVKLYVNGTELTNFIFSTPYKDTIDDELDQTNFQIKSTTRKYFNKNDKIRYWLYVPKDNTNYTLIDKTLCLFDYVETFEGDYYLYQLTCLSPTKLLENLIINGLASTQANAGTPFENLKAQFNSVLERINKILEIELGNISLSMIDNTNVNTLGSVGSNDFLWDGQQTIREILQDICDKADCLITGVDFEITNQNISSITLQIVKREKVGNVILQSNKDIDGGGLNAISNKVKGLSIHRDSNFDYCNIVSLIKNAVCKDNIQQTYLPPRNDDLTIDDASDWHILTDEPIYSLNQVIMFMPMQASVYKWNYNTSQQQWVRTGIEVTYGITILIPVDLTNYIVEKDVFDAMSLTEQSKHLYFKRGEKGIYGLYKKYKSGLTGLFSNTALENIVMDLPQSYINHYENGNNVIDWREIGNPSVLYLDGGVVKKYNNAIVSDDGTIKENAISYYQGIQEPSGSNPHNNLNDFINSNWFKSALFSVNYQPYTDTVVKLEKNIPLTSIQPSGQIIRNDKNLSVLKNQNDRTIDAEKYYKSQQALINRLGNEEMTLDIMFNTSDLADYYESPTTYDKAFYDLGDILKLNWVRDAGVLGDAIGKKYTLTQREIEAFGEEFIKARLTFSFGYNASNSAINVNRDKRLYGIPLNNYIDRYTIIPRPNNKNYTKIAVYCYDDFTSGASFYGGWFILDLTKVGDSSKPDRVARCYDNYSVGISRTKYSSTIVNIGIRYAGTNGNLGSVEFRLLTDSDYNSISISDYSRLPYIDGYSILNNIGDRVLWSNFNKDKMERLVFVIKP